MPVAVADARRGDIPVYLDGLGSVAAFYTVTIRSRIDGALDKVYFREGQYVREGDVLAEIDRRPFRVQLEQAEGQMARDEALLDNARLDVDRYRLLVSQDAIPRQQLDTQLAAVKEAVEQEAAERAAQESLQLEVVRYKAGTVSYLDVITTQTIALNDQRAALQILQRRMAATVQLIRSLGGSWDVGNLPAPETLR